MSDDLSTNRKDEGDFFKEALEDLSNAETSGYLGDKHYVQSILQLAAAEVFEMLPSVVDQEQGPEKLIYEVGKKHMRTFFGAKGNKGVRGFNEPGGIDVFVAKWCGVDETKPTDRLIGGFAAMIGELLEVEGFANHSEALKEQWAWQVEAILDRYAMIFMGISPPQQELLT